MASCGCIGITGNGTVPLLILTGPPDKWALQQNRPLVEWTKAGEIFERALQERGLNRHALVIANLPCMAHLDALVAEYQPRAILCLSDTSLYVLTGHSSTTEYRGFMLPSRYGIPAVGTYDPELLFRGGMHLFGAFLRDMAFAQQIAVEGPPLLPETTYALNPTDTDIRDFLAYLRGDSGRAVAHDLETAAILGDKVDPDRIIQIQFSARAGTALVLPWNSRGIEATKAIGRLSNAKWDWNGRLFDRLLLRRAGIELSGELHDLMLVWQHLQPAYGSGRDDKAGEKGVPSRLMSLQSAVSFFVPGSRPWKHPALPDWSFRKFADQPLPLPLRLYGGRDVDYSYRCGVGLFESIRSAGITAGYREHKYELCKALDAISTHGLPINRERQLGLRAYTEAELARLADAMQDKVPVEVRGVHPKGGYAKAKYELGSYVKLKSAEGLVVERQFGDEIRTCLLKPFNPGSKGEKGQVGQYIKHMGYRMPTKVDDPEKGTTGKDELRKLASETGDAVLSLICDYTDLRKTGMDYTSGAWVPGPDGRVHPVFRPNTASGQLTAQQPNSQQFPEHSQLAKRAKEMIAAEPGHKLVKIDMRGFHSRMIGWLANDAAYYKLADFDVHSFVAAHFLKLEGADYLLDLPDDELRAALGTIKKQHGYVRNFKIKRVVHGSQFGLGVKKLYRMHQKDFSGPEEAAQLMHLLKSLFPATFKEFPKTIRHRIYHETPGRLVSPFGHHRFFFDYDMEQATAYLPSNCAHCEIQSSMVRQHRAGAFRTYGCCNMVHDSLWFHPVEAWVRSCVSYVVGELQRPSTVLVDSPLGPFQCNADVEVGDDLAHMEAYQ